MALMIIGAVLVLFLIVMIEIVVVAEVEVVMVMCEGWKSFGKRRNSGSVHDDFCQFAAWRLFFLYFLACTGFSFVLSRSDYLVR